MGLGAQRHALSSNFSKVEIQTVQFETSIYTRKWTSGLFFIRSYCEIPIGGIGLTMSQTVVNCAKAYCSLK